MYTHTNPHTCKMHAPGLLEVKLACLLGLWAWCALWLECFPYLSLLHLIYVNSFLISLNILHIRRAVFYSPQSKTRSNLPKPRLGQTSLILLIGTEHPFKVVVRVVIYLCDSLIGFSLLYYILNSVRTEKMVPSMWKTPNTFSWNVLANLWLMYLSGDWVRGLGWGV